MIEVGLLEEEEDEGRRYGSTWWCD